MLYHKAYDQMRTKDEVCTYNAKEAQTCFSRVEIQEVLKHRDGDFLTQCVLSFE